MFKFLPSFLAFSLLITGVTGLTAQAPANDSCQNAIEIVLDQIVEFSTIGATTDGPNHPVCFNSDNDSIPKDIWYVYTATLTGDVIWSNCGTADYDSRIAVYAASSCPVTDADLVACNDDGPTSCSADFFTSEMRFPVENGQTYLLRLGGFGSDPGEAAEGTGTIVLTEAPPGPVNDNCENAIPVFLGEGQEFNTTTATTDGPDHPGDPMGCFGFGSVTADRDIWYTFSPDFTGTVQWSTCDMITFDSRLVVYTANATCPVTAEDLYACNDDGAGCPAYTSSLIFEVVAGETYLLRLGGFGGDSGFGVFDLAITEPPIPPDNDGCMNPDSVYILTRQEADDFDVIFEGTTVNGTIDASFAFPVCIASTSGEYSDVWYRFNSLGNTELEIRFNAVSDNAAFFVDLFSACGELVDTSMIGGSCNFIDVGEFIIDTITNLPPVNTEFYLRVSTRVTFDFPGEFWFQLVGDITTAAHEPDLTGFDYFPNPVTETLTTRFGLKEAGRVRLEVYNPLGQRVALRDEGMLHQGENEVHLTTGGLPDGVYILTIRVDDRWKSVKFIKQ